MKLYLAGPMRGLPEDNYPAFHAAAQQLRALYVVVNPAELLQEHGLPMRMYLQVDLPALLDCHGVALLPRWEFSEGARLERQCGIVAGMKCAPVEWWLTSPLAMELREGTGIQNHVNKIISVHS